MNIKKFTSEAVSEGHPDKVADQISDKILDLYLSQDPYAKVACETLVTEGKVILAGEITSTASIGKSDRALAARTVINDLGYSNFGFNPFEVEILDLIHTQSPDINQCVVKGDVAGDQGIMFGYATNESPDYMPLAFSIARKILRNLTNLKHPFLGPDSKCLVTTATFDDRKPIVSHVLVSSQHVDYVSQKVLEDIITPVIVETIREYQDYLDPELITVPDISINPSGRFVFGGPAADTGLTGRKIIVDSYGGACPHGGGAYSGKDPSKVDRSAAYYARYMAKNMVAAGLCDKVLVSISYSIGSEYPVSIAFDTMGTNKTPYTDAELVPLIVPTYFDPRTSVFVPSLRIPIYYQTAKEGHFGFDTKTISVVGPDKKLQEIETYPWEKVDVRFGKELFIRNN